MTLSAIAGRITSFSKGTSLTGTWTPIPDVMSFSMGEVKVDSKSFVTNSTSGIRFSIPGNVEFGEMELTFLSGTESMALQVDASAKTVTFYQVVLADASSLAFEGYCTSFKINSVDEDSADPLTITAKFKPCGSVTIA